MRYRISKVFSIMALVLVGVIILSSCAGHLVREAEMKQCNCVDSYCMSLRDGYLERAKFELRKSDPEDAAFFARKASAVCHGDLVLPQDPRQRRLHEALELDAQTYRLRLMRIIAGGIAFRSGNSGALLGAAQVSFDCWVQKLEEGHQVEDVDFCKYSMQRNLDAIR